MQNRDYFTGPSQATGRSAHGYGHTRLSTDRQRIGWPMWLGVAIVIAYFICRYVAA